MVKLLNYHKEYKEKNAHRFDKQGFYNSVKDLGKYTLKLKMNLCRCHLSLLMDSYILD